MGRSHAVSGLAGGVALFSPAVLPHPALHIGPLDVEAGVIPLGAYLGHMSVPYVALACVVLAVCALIPDWDTPSSYVSTCLPPLSGAISKPLTALGHRTLTHSPLGFALFGLVVAAASAPVVLLGGIPIRPGNGIVVGLGAAMAARALGAKPGCWPVLWCVGVVGFLLGGLMPAPALWFMPVAVVAGMWLHRIGDAITTQGAPCAAWPVLKRPRLRLPVLGDAGSRREHALFWLMCLYVAWGWLVLLLTAW